MMGRSHLTCGLIFGVGVATVLGDAPLPVRLLVIPVAGGSALLPDIDTKNSRVSRSLGLITRFVAMGVASVAVTVYNATRTDTDSPGSNGGHRRLSHTIPGCIMFGVTVGFAVWVHPLAGTVAMALICGLTSVGFRSIGLGSTLLAGLGSWFVLTRYTSWWWLWPLAVSLGSWVHCLGDTVTSSGTPMLWPMTRDGKRWGMVKTAFTFDTNSDFEVHVVQPLLVAFLVLAVGVMVLTPQTIWHWMHH